MTTPALVLGLTLCSLAAACGGAVQNEAGSESSTKTPEPSPTGVPVVAADASAGPSTSVSGGACVQGGACTGQARCRPCGDRCDIKCQELSCVQGTWRAPRTPTLDPSCFDGGAAAACVLPPVDVTSCTTSADCAIAFKGCWCGKRPAFGVNKSYVSVVQQCEDATELACARDCNREPGYSFGSGSTATSLSELVPYCDTSPESGVCSIQVAN